MSCFDINTLFFKAINSSRACYGLLLLVGFLCLGGCTGTGKLQEGEYLYTGAQVKFDSPKPIPNKAELETEVQAVLTPEPNMSFFGIRPGIFFYNLAGTPKKEKGLRSFIKNTLGEEPVLLQAVKPDRVSNLIVNRLKNNGYFSPSVSHETQTKGKTASVTYTAHINQPYVINKVFYPTADSLPQVYRDIAAVQEESLLKPGDIYDLDDFTAERVRIDAELKNKGYYYFNPEFILFKVDSTLNSRTLNVYLRIKPDVPERGIIPYNLGDIIIYTDYSLSQDSIPEKPPVRIGGYQYFPDEESLKAKRLLPSVFLEKGGQYSRRNHALTVSRLMGLGLFRYVDIEYTQPDTTVNVLNVVMRLTPMQLQSMRAELETVNQSNGFAGPGFNANYRHRNLLRGAEQLQLKFNVAQQTSVNSDRSGLNSFELGTQAELNVPRFITPFNLTNLRTAFVPRTRFTLGVNYQNRVQFFQLMGYNATYSYVWKPKPLITHEVTPINVQYAQLGNITEEFRLKLDNNPFLRRSFEEQFILGSIYNFTYNTQLQKSRKNNIFFNGNIDVSGNILNAFKTVVMKSEDDPNTLARRPYAQYTRLSFDTRYYFGLTSKSQLATRMLIGAGIPYGNSRTLPYIKQFYIGGPNSIRAFRPRSIGPGTYQDTTSSGFFDQTGDIRFETNVEYRFDIIPYLKGAVFVDAGNIWLARRSADRPGGEFVFSNALQQLAIGTGAGLRIDAEFFVLRFDLGIPIRAPYEEKPTVLKIPPERKGMVLHIAVGYPF